MIKGYLTVFLSLSLSVLTGFVLLLTGGAIRNGEKIRLECGLDIAANAALSEYHIGLLEKYDLLYIDASYLALEPSVENLENRIRYYTEENINLPWGKLSLQEAEIPYIETAAAGMGASMRSQAVAYIKDKREETSGQWNVLAHMEELRSLDAREPMALWSGLMEQIAGMELPKVKNKDGIWEEIPLSNPADLTYSFFGSDIFYLSEVDLSTVSNLLIPLQDYISHRQIENTESRDRKFENDEEAFLSYLFEKMGYLEKPAQGEMFSCQLEYAACGRSSDLENVRMVGNKLFHWRFADNLSCAFSDDELRNQAALLADVLVVVQMNPAFREPVIQSILCACAYLESINDVRILYDGGCVPVKKEKLHISADYVLTGSLYKKESSSGLSYQEYLAGMLLLQSEEQLNLRVMDIMEMEMRRWNKNPAFAMDWCIERYQIQLKAKSNFGDIWYLDRKYGYY